MKHNPLHTWKQRVTPISFEGEYMKREELVNAIKLKMDIDPADNDDYYKNFYNTLINECLSNIVNTVLPYQRKIEVFYGGKLLKNDISGLKSPYYYKLGVDVLDDEGNILYKKNGWLYYKKIESEDSYGNTTITYELSYQPYNNFGFMIDIPDDLLSFSDESLVMFVDENGKIELNADILYVNSKTLALPKDGNYTIWYNSEYPEVTDDNDMNLNFIPKNVLKIIPTYVASQLLLSEDPVKATYLKNDYETMLSRLDDNKPLASYEIKNSNGWTL